MARGLSLASGLSPSIFKKLVMLPIEKAGKLGILASGMDVSAQVLELGHHGSLASIDPEWLKYVALALAFWQARTDNNYGHPHQEILNSLKELHIQAIGTDEYGKLVISAQRDGSFRVNTTDGLLLYPVILDCIDLNMADIQQVTDIIHIGEARAFEIFQGRPWDKIVEAGALPEGTREGDWMRILENRMFESIQRFTDSRRKTDRSKLDRLMGNFL